jgi:hypothetical protein
MLWRSAPVAAAECIGSARRSAFWSGNYVRQRPLAGLRRSSVPNPRSLQEVTIRKRNIADPAALPGFHHALAELEQRVRIGHPTRSAVVPSGRTSKLKLCPQMCPLVLNLTKRDGHGDSHARSLVLSPIERVSPGRSLDIYGLQISSNGAKRRRMILESNELGVAAVAACCAAKYSLGQKRLSPERYKSLPVQIPRMQRPEPHEFCFARHLSDR